MVIRGPNSRSRQWCGRVNRSALTPFPRNLIRLIKPSFERELIRERTGEGRKRAPANGVKFDRKLKLSAFQRVEAIKRRGAGEPLAPIAQSYAVSESMIGRL